MSFRLTVHFLVSSGGRLKRGTPRERKLPSAASPSLPLLPPSPLSSSPLPLSPPPVMTVTLRPNAQKPVSAPRVLAQDEQQKDGQLHDFLVPSYSVKE